MNANFFNSSFMGNTVTDYIVFISIIAGGCITITIIKKHILKWIISLTKTIYSKIDAGFAGNCEKIFIMLLYFSVFYLAFKSINLNPAIIKFINTLWIVILSVSVIRVTVAVVDLFLKNIWAKKELEMPNRHSYKVFLQVFKGLVWGIGLIFMLDNFGFKVSSIIAGLGIGGIAIAMACQTILTDLFSSFAIIFDRPFEIGDFIIVDQYLGSVEHIGIKTTRIRSLGGEELVFSNSDLTKTRIRNFKRMDKRRIIFQFGITYDTATDQLQQIPEIIKNIITGIEKTSFDRAHFFSFGNSGLIYEVVYYVLSNDYNIYMDIQQELNISLKKELENKGIKFAFPTQTVYVNRID